MYGELIGLFIVIGISLIIIVSNLTKHKKTTNSINNYQNYLSNNQLTENDLETVFQVDGVFHKDGKILVTGKAIKGVIRVGDKLSFINNNQEVQTVTVVKMEKFREQIEYLNTGDFCGIIIDINIKIYKSAYLFKTLN